VRGDDALGLRGVEPGRRQGNVNAPGELALRTPGARRSAGADREDQGEEGGQEPSGGVGRKRGPAAQQGGKPGPELRGSAGHLASWCVAITPFRRAAQSFSRAKSSARRVVTTRRPLRGSARAMGRDGRAGAASVVVMAIPLSQGAPGFFYPLSRFGRGGAPVRMAQYTAFGSALNILSGRRGRFLGYAEATAVKPTPGTLVRFLRQGWSKRKKSKSLIPGVLPIFL